MAIAAPVELDEWRREPNATPEMPWPRPVLRVVAGGHGRRGPSSPEVGGEPSASPDHQVRRGPDVAWRRAQRARVQRRRRRLLSGLVAAGLCTALALPLSFLGGAAPRALRVPGTTLTGATVYVVRPGDTLWSIAARFDHGGDPRPLAEALARETGSATLVPGERIAVR